MKKFAARSHKPYARLETGKHNYCSQEQRPVRPEIMTRNSCKYQPSIFMKPHSRHARSPYISNKSVQDHHQRHSKHPGFQSSHGNIRRTFDSLPLYGLNHHYSKCKRSQRIHSIVAFLEPRYESQFSVITRRSAKASHRIHYAGHYQNKQKRKKRRSQVLSYIVEYLCRIQRKIIYQKEEQKTEHPKIKAKLIRCDIRLKSHYKRNRRSPRNGKQRTNRKIKRHREHASKNRMDPSGKLAKTAAACHPYGKYAQERQPYRSCHKTDKRRPEISPGQLTHLDWKNKISCPKEHPKQHGPRDSVNRKWYFFFQNKNSFQKTNFDYCNIFYRSFPYYNI